MIQDQSLRSVATLSFSLSLTDLLTLLDWRRSKKDRSERRDWHWFAGKIETAKITDDGTLHCPTSLASLSSSQLISKESLWSSLSFAWSEEANQWVETSELSWRSIPSSPRRVSYRVLLLALQWTGQRAKTILRQLPRRDSYSAKNIGHLSGRVERRIRWRGRGLSKGKKDKSFALCASLEGSEPRSFSLSKKSLHRIAGWSQHRRRTDCSDLSLSIQIEWHQRNSIIR